MEKSALASKQVAGDGEAQLRELQLTQEAQARYMSFLSHDLRGSLNGLVLMVEVLKREIEGKAASQDEVLADLAMMKRALVDTVATMERHVLADRLRRGVLEIKHQPVRLADVVEEAISKAYPAARTRPNIQINLPQEAEVNSDRDLIKTAVVELVDNLARHCGQCDAKISARKFGGAWMIEVADDGPGVPTERLEQFLDPQKRAQLKERGLGLSLVQLVAKALGGRLEARTDEGKGSEFQLWIPIEALERTK
ncbi:MAG TPA: HAMP domain-containing sensor histidine kinase [Tepidisphaeraceae bacterium]|jgi:signal transduction histidine kinase|nr:HAMP domain-containing sensor histidine kinase [Tepidisphaeraceae bacterium]